MKIGSENVASFRLGSITPSKVYLGSVEVWSYSVATAPGAVTNVTAITSTTQQSAADISWTAPASDGGAAISGYNIYYSEDGGSTWNLGYDEVQSPFTLAVPDRGGSTIKVRVTALNVAGEGATDSAQEPSVTLSAGPASPPVISTGSYASNSRGTVSGQGSSASPLTYSGVNGKYSSFTVTAETLSAATLTKTGGGTTMVIYGSAPFTVNGSQAGYDYDNERYSTPSSVANGTYSLVFSPGAYTVEVYNCGGGGCNVSFGLAFA
jgi:hypothetical protein